MISQLSLLLVPIAAACGWYAAKREFCHNHEQQQAHNPSQFHQDYFKGLNYLINEEPDKAVDVFIRLLEVDSDTVETHLALGNLFRRRGEVDRAIRVHQNLIARPQLNKPYKLQAMSALGQDYLRAGVLDRAEKLFLQLVNIGQQNEASLCFLLNIYQQEKDWLKAIEIAKKLAAITQQSQDVLIAQYYCELAEQAQTAGDSVGAYQYLKQAVAADARCVRASIISANLAKDAENYKEAMRFYRKVSTQDADYLSEIIEPLGFCYRKLEREQEYIDYLYECLKKYPRISIVLAISQYLQMKDGDKEAIEFIAQYIHGQPSLRGLHHLVGLYLFNASGDTKDKLSMLQNFMNRLLHDKPIYRCKHCGFSCKTLFWLCPGCHYWVTIRPIQGLEGS